MAFIPPTYSAVTSANPSGAKDPKSVGTDNLLAKHGSDKHDASRFGALPPRPGSAPRGRPRKDGLPSGSDFPPPSARIPAVAANVAAPTTPDGLPRPPIDPLIVRQSVEACISGIDVIAVAFVTGKAAKVFTTGEARQIGESVRCPAASRETIARALPPVMEKYGVGSAILPEIALLGGFAGWLGGVGIAIKRINEIEEQREKEKNPPKPEPVPAPKVQSPANAPT